MVVQPLQANAERRRREDGGPLDLVEHPQCSVALNGASDSSVAHQSVAAQQHPLPRLGEAEGCSVDRGEAKPFSPDRVRRRDFVTSQEFYAQSELNELGATILFELLLIEKIGNDKIVSELKRRCPKIGALQIDQNRGVGNNNFHPSATTISHGADICLSRSRTEIPNASAARDSVINCS